jgi:hypothetical protein
VATRRSVAYFCSGAHSTEARPLFGSAVLAAFFVTAIGELDSRPPGSVVRARNRTFSRRVESGSPESGIPRQRQCFSTLSQGPVSAVSCVGGLPLSTPREEGMPPDQKRIHW